MHLHTWNRIVEDIKKNLKEGDEENPKLNIHLSSGKEIWEGTAELINEKVQGALMTFSVPPFLKLSFTDDAPIYVELDAVEAVTLADS